MMYTSAQANKLLGALNAEREMILRKEESVCVFTAATSEDVECARPEYDYGETWRKLEEYEEKIRKVKHAINAFNVTHEIPGYGMTIDQALVYIPQLTMRKRKLEEMGGRLAKTRCYRHGSDLIEYTYANYDVDRALADYKATASELSRLQNALDLENSTVKFEIDI